MRRISHYKAKEGDIVVVGGKKYVINKIVIGFEGDRFFYTDKDDLPRVLKAYDLYREEVD